MRIADLPAWLEATPFSLAMAESAWLFPAAESAHVIALTLVVGSISIVDLRLLGVASRRRSAPELAAAILPLTWVAFAGAVVTGALLFAAKPTSYLANPFFLGKLALLALAGLNMAAFHLLLARRLDGASGHTPPPLPVRISAGLSLSLWVAVVGFGRWIGFSI